MPHDPQRGAGQRGLTRDGAYDRGDARVGANVDDFLALATLRTFRGKLTYAVEVTQAPDQMTLAIDSKPPTGGEIGGNDLAITPNNFSLVNQALRSGDEIPIFMEIVAPAEWRSETEIGRSMETVGQLLPRVTRGIDRILARVYGHG